MYSLSSRRYYIPYPSAWLQRWSLLLASVCRLWNYRPTEPAKTPATSLPTVRAYTQLVPFVLLIDFILRSITLKDNNFHPILIRQTAVSSSPLPRNFAQNMGYLLVLTLEQGSNRPPLPVAYILFGLCSLGIPVIDSFGVEVLWLASLFAAWLTKVVGCSQWFSAPCLPIMRLPSIWEFEFCFEYLFWPNFLQLESLKR